MYIRKLSCDLQIICESIMGYSSTNHAFTVLIYQQRSRKKEGPGVYERMAMMNPINDFFTGTLQDTKEAWDSLCNQM